MSHEIDTYRPNTLGDPAAYAPPQAEEESAPKISVIGAIRRRWRLMLLFWILIPAVGVPLVWIYLQRAYKATAQIEFKPVVSPVLYENEKSGVMPYFMQFLNNQIEVIKSNDVLGTALKDPAIQDLDLLKVEDPIGLLRRSLEAEIIGGTTMMEVGAVQLQPEEAVRLCTAVLSAYMSGISRSEGQETINQLEILDKERKETEQHLAGLLQKKQELGGTYGTISSETLESMRQEHDKALFDLKHRQLNLDLELGQLKSQLKMLEEEVDSTTYSEQELQDREIALRSNPMISHLEMQIDKAAADYLRLNNLDPGGVGATSAKSDMDRLKVQLAGLREEVGQQVDQELRERRAQRTEGRRNDLKREIKLREEHQLQVMDAIAVKQEEAMKIGNQSLGIQALRDQMKSTEDELARINERIKELQIESQRAPRITVASWPEVRPEGILDGRKKRTMMIVLAGLCLGVFAAMIRDLMDPSLHAPQQVEALLGVPVLGAVPCLSELRSRRITQDDFLESYRVVRAALSSFGEDGRPPRSLLVTSAQAGEGKTSLAVSLAASLAEPGARVLLIDGDLQAPQVGTLLHVKKHDGLQAVLNDHVALAEAISPSPLRGVDILASVANGHGRASITSGSASRILREALALYDHVVIDTPPALGAADAMVWSRVVDGVVLSSLAGHTDTAAMKLATQRLRGVNARILGAVVGNVPSRETYWSVSASRSSHEERNYWALIPARPLDEQTTEIESEPETTPGPASPKLRPT